MELELPLPIRGLILGFTIAAAVGPISLLTMRRTLAHGRLYGLVSGAGVATADATYAAIAAFGLTALTDALVSGKVILGVVGGAIIVLLGVRTLRSRPGEVARDTAAPGLLHAFGSIYALTMTNPSTILSFAALFTGLGLVIGASPADATLLVLAVWIGSLAWWLVLTAVVAWARDRVTPRALLWVNRLSGAALIAFGVLAVVSSLVP